MSTAVLLLILAAMSVHCRLWSAPSRPDQLGSHRTQANTRRIVDEITDDAYHDVTLNRKSMVPKTMTRFKTAIVVDIVDFPHQIALHRNGDFVCGGSIISKTWALTAAHCIVKNAPVQFFTVRSGSGTLYSGGQVHKVDKYVVHPDWKWVPGNNDYCLVRVEQPFKYSKDVQPIRLASSPPKGGADVAISGWGSNNGQGPVGDPYLLQAVVFKVMPEERCRRVRPKVFSNVMICAKNYGGSICSTDSGGALVDVDQNIQVGVLSGGIIPCQHPVFPPVFSSVASARGWIYFTTGV